MVFRFFRFFAFQPKRKIRFFQFKDSFINLNFQLQISPGEKSKKVHGAPDLMSQKKWKKNIVFENSKLHSENFEELKMLPIEKYGQVPYIKRQK